MQAICQHPRELSRHFLTPQCTKTSKLRVKPHNLRPPETRGNKGSTTTDQINEVFKVDSLLEFCLKPTDQKDHFSTVTLTSNSRLVKIAQQEIQLIYLTVHTNTVRH